MNRKPDFDSFLTSWIDEGADRAPERFVWAAIEEVERTPQRGAWMASTEEFLMQIKRMAPLLGIAAAVVLAIVAYQIVGTRNMGDPDPTVPSASASASTPAATPSAEACGATTAVAAAGRINVNWCSVRGDGAIVAVPFSMDAPADWLDQWFGTSRSLWLLPADGGRIAFYVQDVSVEEMVEDIGGRSGYLVENQTPVTLGGIEGIVFDVSLAEGTTSGEAPPLIEGPEQDWLVQPDPARAWIVAREGETLMIVTNAERADALGDALETIEWGN